MGHPKGFSIPSRFFCARDCERFDWNWDSGWRHLGKSRRELFQVEFLDRQGEPDKVVYGRSTGM